MYKIEAMKTIASIKKSRKMIPPAGIFGDFSGFLLTVISDPSYTCDGLDIGLLLQKLVYRVISLEVWIIHQY
jgi:hypothetical protein